MNWLQAGPGRALLDLFRDEGFDIRLREDYFNVYEAQCSLARVRWMRRAGTGRLSVHRAYLQAASSKGERQTGYQSFDVTAAFVARYAAMLPAIRRNACKRHGKEGLLEAQCLRDNRAGTPLLVVDRQIRLPGGRDRLDVLAVSGSRARRLMVAVELKRGLDNRIQAVATQTLKYLEMLDPKEAGLSAAVAQAYQRVCAQLRAIGWQAPDPDLIEAGMPVAGLVALADYKAKSQLLSRAEAAAKNLSRPVAFCLLESSHFRLPDPATWRSLLPVG
jgi:hypothetical protein